MDDQQAGEIVLAILQDHHQPPNDLAVSHSEDAGDAWRIFCTTRLFLMTGEIGYALAGNWPFLVDKQSGEVVPDEDYRREALGLDTPQTPDEWTFVGTDEDPDGNNRKAFHAVLARYPHLIKNPDFEVRMDVARGRDGIARVQVWQRATQPKNPKKRLP